MPAKPDSIATHPIAAPDSSALRPVTKVSPDSISHVTHPADLPRQGGAPFQVSGAASPMDAAVGAGLENVSAGPAGTAPSVAYENRRYRHPADVFGILQRDFGSHFTAVERRLGMPAAAVEVSGMGATTQFHVRYPSDPDFPKLPHERVAAPTSHTVDLLVQPVIGYELGRFTAPVQFEIQAEPMIQYNPWPGALATASWLFPLYNSFEFDPNHPDLDQNRPGRLNLQQFAWIPRVALASGTVGLFGNNRYGGSFGVARPIAEGRVILDGQYDRTGFVAFEGTGTTYSSANQWDAFGSAVWNMPWFDSAVTLRAGRFEYGDHGFYGEYRRSFGDFDYTLFYIRSKPLRIEGIRVTVPIPPLTRPTHQVVRALPIDRFPVSYRTDATPLGEFVTGVASRTDYLRQLNVPALEANRYRLDRERRTWDPRDDKKPVQWIDHSGMTGFIFTPWVGSLRDGTISLDYTHVPAKWSYSGRGKYVNQAYSMTVGLLPRVEASLRFTRLPGAYGFLQDIDNRITTDTDHMASGRLVLLTSGPMRPGLAVGIDDISGTRRFHSTYAVTGMPLEINRVQTRFSLGYAPRVFTAARHVLDGGFGAFEISPCRDVAARLEYDSEKWNVGIGVALPYGLRIRAAALNLETLSVGAGWTHEL